MTTRILHAFSTFQAAGPQVRTVALLNDFGDAYEHSILAFDGRTDARERIGSHVPATILTEPPRAGSVATIRAMRKLLKQDRHDVVMTYNWGAMDALVAARSLGIPVVHHEDGFRPDEVDGFKLRRVLVRRALLGGVKRVVVPSEMLGRIAREVWKLKDALVIPNGIHIEQFGDQDKHRSKLRAELGIDADTFVVGTVGHLRPEKNPLRLLDAFAQLEGEPHLILVGDGPERAALEERARPIANRVHLVGHQEDPARWLTALDAFALPSDTEQMPVALLEAMATGLPAASTDVGDVRAILPEVQGNLVVARDATLLAQALGRLQHDPKLRTELAQANLKRVQDRFSFRVMRDAYADLWRSLSARN